MSTGLQSVSPRVDAPAPPSTDAETSLGAKGDKPDAEFTFNDLIDIINPLQHLPVVSTIYRAITGDEISTHARAIGGGLYGGPLGMLAAGAIMAIEEAAGTNPSEQLAALFNSDSGDAPEQAGGVQVAAAPGTSPATAAAAAASPEAMALAAAPGGANTAAAPVPTAAEGPVMPFTARSGRRFFALPSADGQQMMPLGRDPAAVQTLQASHAARLQALKAAEALSAPATASTDANAPASAGSPQLNLTQGALLDRFIAGAQSPDGKSDGRASHPGMAPPEGATAEWFAARMQANLQKYAETQAQNDRRPQSAAAN